MQVAVDPRAPEAPFEQIRAQIAARARSGELPAGTRLPTVRGLADELAVAPGTVARAYRTLEEDGVIETRGRHGTFIAAGGDATARAAFAAAVEYVTRLRRLGLGREEALHQVEAALRASGD